MTLIVLFSYKTPVTHKNTEDDDILRKHIVIDRWYQQYTIENMACNIPTVGHFQDVVQKKYKKTLQINACFLCEIHTIHSMLGCDRSPFYKGICRQMVW